MSAHHSNHDGGDGASVAPESGSGIGTGSDTSHAVALPYGAATRELTWMDVADYADVHHGFAPGDIGDVLMWRTHPDGTKEWIHASPDTMLGELALDLGETRRNVRRLVRTWVDNGRPGSVYGAEAHAREAAKTVRTPRVAPLERLRLIVADACTRLRLPAPKVNAPFVEVRFRGGMHVACTLHTASITAVATDDAAELPDALALHQRMLAAIRTLGTEVCAADSLGSQASEGP